MRTAIRLWGLILVIALAGHGQTRRSVIVGLKPSPPQDEGSSVGNHGILFVAPFGICQGEPDAKTFEDRLEMTYLQEPGRANELWVYRPGGLLAQELFMRPGRRTTRDLTKADPIAVSWGPQLDFFIERNFEMLSWDDAMKVLERDDLKGGKQYHSGWLTIFQDDERAFLTKPPDISFTVEFAKQHEGFGVE